MKNKKIFLLLLVALLILFSYSFCFANDMKNTAESATNHVKNFAKDTGNKRYYKWFKGNDRKN